MIPQVVVAVVGPTASGKTELAVALAEQLQGELLSADSRQVFRGCDIGTNKPTPVELRGIPCHLLDLVQPGERFTVADYRQAALAAIDRVAGHGHLPIFQGGTGLYLRAVFEGWNLAGAPPVGDRALIDHDHVGRVVVRQAAKRRSSNLVGDQPLILALRLG